MSVWGSEKAQARPSPGLRGGIPSGNSGNSASKAAPKVQRPSSGSGGAEKAQNLYPKSEGAAGIDECIEKQRARLILIPEVSLLIPWREGPKPGTSRISFRDTSRISAETTCGTIHPALLLGNTAIPF